MNTYITELTTFGDFKSTPFSNVEYVSKFIAYKLFNIQNIYSCMQIVCKLKTQKTSHLCEVFKMKWSHLGSNQGPPDYESGALTN